MVDRGMTTAAKNALAGKQVRAVVFVEMNFPTGFLRVNNSAVSLNWNGYEWLGVGRLGSIDQIEEGNTLEARGLRFSISGIEPAHVAIAIGQQYQGRDCKVWFAPLNEDYVPQRLQPCTHQQRLHRWYGRKWRLRRFG